MTPGLFTACQMFARSTMCVTSTWLFSLRPKLSSRWNYWLTERSYEFHLRFHSVVPALKTIFNSVAASCRTVTWTCLCQIPSRKTLTLHSERFFTSPLFPTILTPSCFSRPSTLSEPGAIGPYSNRSSERYAQLVIDMMAVVSRLLPQGGYLTSHVWQPSLSVMKLYPTRPLGAFTD